MTESTPIIFYVDARVLLVGIFVFFSVIFSLVWKGKKEIEDIIDKKLGILEKKVDSLVVAVPKLYAAVIEIQKIISVKIKGAIISQPLVETNGSPLRPTAYGVQLIVDSGLEKIIAENKEDLCIKLKAVLPKDYGEYDVQENARNLLVNLKDDPIMKPVKEYVYNNPMDIEIILKAGGLWLRDDFLGQARQVSTEKL